MKRPSSLRFIECPIPPTSGVVRGSWIMFPSLPVLGGGRSLAGRGDAARRGFGLGGAYRRRRVLDGLHDVHVARAAAQIARNRAPYLAFARAGVALQQRGRRHHHARSAVSTLQSVLLLE